jgi:hypothetical protein
MSVLTRNANFNERFFYADIKVCCQSIIDENISTREFARRHKLYPSRIGKWMRAYKQSISGGRNTLYDDHGGRPNIVGDIIFCNPSTILFLFNLETPKLGRLVNASLVY